MNGICLAIEGIDGAGKTTQISMLAKALGEHGQAVKVCRTELLTTRRVIGVLGAAGGAVPLQEEILLHAADAVHYRSSTIQPLLQSGVTVVWDRGPLSYYAYSRVLSGDTARVDALLDSLPAPDLTIVLDVDAAVAMRRVRSRGEPVQPRETEQFLARVRMKYLSLASQFHGPVSVVDSEEAPELIHRQILGQLWTVLNAAPGTPPV